MDLNTLHKLCRRVFFNLNKVDKSNLDKESIECLEKAKTVNVNITKAIYEKMQKTELTVVPVNPNVIT